MWPKIAPNQSEQWQRPPLENLFLFIQLFWVDLSREIVANMQKTCGILIQDGVAQIDSLGSIFPSKNGILTICSEKFQSIVADFRLWRQVFDSW